MSEKPAACGASLGKAGGGACKRGAYDRKDEAPTLCGDWKKLEQYRDCGTTFNLKDQLWTLFLYEKGLFKIPESLDNDTIYDVCNCGNCHFTISAEGRLMACRRFDSYVGTVNEEMFEVYDGEKMEKFRQHERFEKCSKCVLLRFCRGCPTVSYGYTKNFYAPDPQCWKEVKMKGE